MMICMVENIWKNNFNSNYVLKNMYNEIIYNIRLEKENTGKMENNKYKYID